MSTSKKCKKCGEVKPIGKFGITKGYIRNTCKTCIHKAQKKYPYFKAQKKKRNDRQNKKYREELADTYIKVQLRNKGILITPELIEIQRQILLLKRNIKKITDE